MTEAIGPLAPTVWDVTGGVETVYIRQVPAQVTADGWWVTSLDVGGWTPLSVGDCVVALDYEGPGEWLVEVVEVSAMPGEVFYRVRRLADLEAGIYKRWDRRPARGA